MSDADSHQLIGMTTGQSHTYEHSKHLGEGEERQMAIFHWVRSIWAACHWSQLIIPGEVFLTQAGGVAVTDSNSGPVFTEPLRGRVLI